MSISTVLMSFQPFISRVFVFFALDTDTETYMTHEKINRIISLVGVDQRGGCVLWARSNNQFSHCRRCVW